MEDRPYPDGKNIHARELSSERVERAAVESYFQDLGLDWHRLRGKMVLDVGAGQADFARAARSRGVAVTSVDVEPGGMGHGGEAPPDVPYIVADFRSGVPLPDESFDLIVALASIPGMVEVQHDMEAVLHEAKRLLRPGGEFRFGPDGPWIRPLRADQWDAWFDLLEKVHQGGVLSPEEDDWRMRISPGYEREEERTKELQGLSPAEQVRARAKHTLVDLHALDSSITEHRFTRVIEWPGKNRQQHNSESAYYVVTK